MAELQQQYSNYKTNLQNIAQKIGDVESEAEEHKSVPIFPFSIAFYFWRLRLRSVPPL